MLLLHSNEYIDFRLDPATIELEKGTTLTVPVPINPNVPLQRHESLDLAPLTVRPVSRSPSVVFHPHMPLSPADKTTSN